MLSGNHLMLSGNDLHLSANILVTYSICTYHEFMRDESRFGLIMNSSVTNITNKRNDPGQQLISVCRKNVCFIMDVIMYLTILPS